MKSGIAFLGILERPEVVRAPGDGDRQAVGVVVRERDEVGARLRRRVGRPGLERVGLLRRADLDRAVDLVGADVDDALDLEAPGRVHHDVRAEAVRVDEVVRPGDRAVDVALGREVHDRVVAGHRVLERAGVADVALDELEARAVVDVLQRREVAGVRERVVDGHLVVGVGQHVTHVVGADEPGAAGDELLHVTSSARSGAATADRSPSAAGSSDRARTGSGP